MNMVIYNRHFVSLVIDDLNNVLDRVMRFNMACGITKNLIEFTMLMHGLVLIS